MRLRTLLLLALTALLAAPALAYTIYLKDGSRVVAKEKYKIEGNQALIILPNGTVASYPAGDIDVQRTEAANLNNLGTALMIDGGKTVEVQVNKPKEENPNRLAKLIEQNKAGMRDVSAPAGSAPVRPAAGEPNRGPSGYPDLTTASRDPLRNVDLAAAIRSFVLSRGIDGIEIFEGVAPRRPLLVYNTTSEGAVFKALVASANALLVVRERFPSQVAGFDVLCEAPNAGRGGQFTLDPESAAAVVSGKVDLTRFFVDHVQF
ncbi:MAG: hypothetical protein U0X73_16910 [Thermoanaerobaculia bacterium]